jgi:acyl-CoA synthetase (AMP-forming)/AMP-acid ligase II
MPATDDGRDRWPRRPIPAELAARYRSEGWWSDDSLGAMVERGLGSRGGDAFRVRSAVRSWDGTFADVDRAARALAGALRARGVGAGDVVVFQLPNWVEAGITFWASAYLGAVVVPIVHFYGPKEVGYILDATEPSVVVTPDRFGYTDHLGMYDELLAHRADPLWLVVDTASSGLPARAAALDQLLDAEPIAAPAPVDPDSPAIIGFTSGTTRDPKGVVHSHRTIGFEARQLDHMFPVGGPPQITGAPVGHFIGMLNAFLMPLLRERPVNLVDVWDPATVLRLMRDEGLGMGGGAAYFLTSLLDHPDFTPEHLPLMPFAGLGGSTIPVALTERATRLGIKTFRSYGSTEHPSISGCLITEPEVKRLTTDGHALPGVEIRLDDESGEIISRGPDCCVGYTDPALTAAAFDEEGWYRTGDVGVLDDEGYLTITDRLSDIIIRGGENISAQELEELLLGIDGIAEVAVVAAPDERLGEHAAAVVRMLGDAPTPSLDEVRGHLGEAGLARQKWPESIHPVEDFPRTASGKIQKFRLRAQLRDGSLG